VALGELSPAQRDLLDRLTASELADTFYLSGGTALAAFYLHHRRSDDLDLFSRQRFDSTAVLQLVNAISEVEPVARRVHDRLGFVLRVRGEPLRVEFVHYDFEPVEPPQAHYGRLRVDGLRDILANKLSAVIDRVEPKDFADLFFLLRRPGIDLTRGISDCRRKFGWPGLEHLLQTALLRAERLPGWPQTDPPSTREEAATFFRERVRGLIQLDDDS
jgi:hypothetical protein